MQEEKKCICPSCGGYNFGVQTHCLMCKAPLPSQVVKAPEPISSAASACKVCGAALKPEQKFCTNCGAQR
jgi:predicted nucleic acid-binding Zn ribbon protein